MSADPHPGGASRRLGDLLRVVGTLGRLSDEEKALLGDLIPGDHPSGPATRSDHRGQRPRPTGSLPGPAGAAEDGQPALNRRRHWWGRASRRIVEALRSMLALVTSARRRPARIVAAAVGLTALVGGVLLVVMGYVILAMAVWTAPTLIALGWARDLLHWWRSPVRLSRVTSTEAYDHVTRDEAAGGPLTFKRTSWTPPPPATPLTAATQQRALAMALAGTAVGGRINVLALVDDFAQRRARRAPPRLPRPSLRRGVQLIVDRGPALEPFRGDLERLRNALLSVVSQSGMDEIGFESDPGTVVRRRRHGGRVVRGPWPAGDLLPAPGTPVVVVTDLGIAVPKVGPLASAMHNWLEQYEAFRRARVRALFLVPYPPARWPPVVARRLPVVYWADRLRPGEVARIARRVERST
jgi:hypothetical protein